jgi:predicted dehydrogenase
MTLSRREFMIAGAAAAAGLALRSKPVYACVYGHTGRGGYGHGLDTCFNFLENMHTVAVADPDEKGLAAAMKRLGLTKGYPSLAEMLDKENAHMVSIGPRFAERKLEYISVAAKKGVSVYMEKPIAASLEEADAIVDVAEKAGIQIVVAHHVRLCPQVLHLKKMVDEGLIGQLLEIRTRGKEDQRAGGEDMMVLGTHCMYLMRFFGGDPLWCTARVTQDGRDITAADKRAASEPLGPVAGDTIDASFAFPKAVMGHFASHKVPKGEGGRFQITLHGSKGVAQFAIGQDPKVTYLLDPLWTQGKAAEWKPLPDAPSNDHMVGVKGTDACNARIVYELLKIRGTKDRSPVDIYEARSTLEMIMAVYAAHLSGARATFPLKDRKHPLGSL